jgi:hypothetical protein
VVGATIGRRIESLDIINVTIIKTTPKRFNALV